MAIDAHAARIPRVIHYCWFGRGQKPSIVNKCLESWKTVLGDYTIQEWNEDNFDVRCNAYVRQAYESGKFAFVSDYVRVYALHHFGGIYLDTDVEVFKPFDDLLHHDSFWGFEQANFIATSTIGAAAGNPLIRAFLDSYQGKAFIHENGTYNELTNVAVITSLLKEYGLLMNGKQQQVEGVGTFYPQSFFSPYDYINCINRTSEHTYAMHYFYKSWLPPSTRLKTKAKVILSRIIGGDNMIRLRKIVNRGADGT